MIDENSGEGDLPTRPCRAIVRKQKRGFLSVLQDKKRQYAVAGTGAEAGIPEN